jgi:hypothetical protein
MKSRRDGCDIVGLLVISALTPNPSPIRGEGRKIVVSYCKVERSGIIARLQSNLGEIFDDDYPYNMVSDGPVEGTV